MKMCSERKYREDEDHFDSFSNRSFGFEPLFEPLFEPIVSISSFFWTALQDDIPPVKINTSPEKMKYVSPHAIKVIVDIANKAKLKEVTITSTFRDDSKQVLIMYSNFSLEYNRDKTLKDSYRLYGGKGDALATTFIESKKKNLSKEETVTAMTKTALKVGFVSDHSNANYSKYNVIDIDRSKASMTESQYQALRKAALSDSRIKVVKGREEGDKALHIEIPIPSEQLRRTGTVTIDEQEIRDLNTRPN